MPNALQTPTSRFGSPFLSVWVGLGFGLLAACGASGDARADEHAGQKTVEVPKTAEIEPSKKVPAEAVLGIADSGIWSDLDNKITLPPPVVTGRGQAVWDKPRDLLVVYTNGLPVKAYPTAGDSSAKVGDHEIPLRPGDAAEVAAIASKLDVTVLAKGDPTPGGDADGDGIPNALDILIGAKKTVLNAASYGAGYIRLEYPGGDVPRDVGVCTDVVIRAVRNAGLDLQSALHEDIRAAKRAYPMVKKRNSHIDHRRVKTILPYFVRNWDERSKKLADAKDPLLPGDVIFMDTFPNKRGPDHIGIVSATKGPSGHPLIINNWTDGSVTEEMDLLSFVPVTHRFRMK